jgi:hypothetical protein
MTDTKEFLKSKIQIGNNKGPINYIRNQTVFHHDDVPERKRERKEDVVEWKRNKIVGPEIHTWNKSVHPNQPVCVRRQMENFDHDRSHKYEYNYRAETLEPLKNVPPIDKSTKFHISGQSPKTTQQILAITSTNPLEAGRFHRTLELPINPKLSDYPEWNQTTILTVPEQVHSLQHLTTKALEWTKKVNTTFTERKEYINPMQRTKQLTKQIRLLKADGLFTSPAVLTQLQPSSEPPPESPRNHYLNDPVMKVKKQVHSGVWERNRVDGR